MRFEHTQPNARIPSGARSLLLTLALGLGLSIGFANCVQAPDLTGYPCGTNERCPPPLICDPATKTCQASATDGSTPTDDKTDNATPEPRVEASTETGQEAPPERSTPDNEPTTSEPTTEPTTEPTQEPPPRENPLPDVPLNDDPTAPCAKDPKLGSTCTIGKGEKCQVKGIWGCTKDKQHVYCVLASGVTPPNTSAPELCNGKDDDCNGLIDEKWPELGGACIGRANLVDTCIFQGKWECSDTSSIKCVGSLKVESKENCDTEFDDNCNGQINEGCTCPLRVGDTQSCRICKGCSDGCAKGQQTCKKDGLTSTKWSECTGTKPAELKSEVCNGADDDCDGSLDNKLPGVGKSCQVQGQTGYCGKIECNSVTKRLECNPQANPKEETAPGDCNRIDDDCDGTVDEGCNCPPKGCLTNSE